MTEEVSPSHSPMSTWLPRAPLSPGTSVLIGVSDHVPGADMYGGVISVPPGGTIPLHWHDDVGELQFVLSGSGLFVLADGREVPVCPHDLVFAPAGANGAHGFRNNSPFPLAML